MKILETYYDIFKTKLNENKYTKKIDNIIISNLSIKDIEAIELYLRITKNNNDLLKQAQISVFLFEANKNNYKKLIREKSNIIGALFGISFHSLLSIYKFIKGWVKYKSIIKNDS